MPRRRAGRRARRRGRRAASATAQDCVTDGRTTLEGSGAAEAVSAEARLRQVTPEPAGATDAPPRAAIASWCSATAHGLHYDLRLEAGGVLVSWAVPKGPTLDPNVKRHGRARRGPSARVLRLRGRHPRGRVRRRRRDRVGLGHVGARRRRRTRSPAVEEGDLHFDLDGEKLRGRFVLVRRGARRRQGAVAAAAQARRRRGRRAGTPRTIRGR